MTHCGIFEKETVLAFYYLQYIASNNRVVFLFFEINVLSLFLTVNFNVVNKLNVTNINTLLPIMFLLLF